MFPLCFFLFVVSIKCIHVPPCICDSYCVCARVPFVHMRYLDVQ